MIRINDKTFNSIQEAVDSVAQDNKEEVVINLDNGVYKEVVTITKPYITIKGQGPSSTIITFNRYGREMLGDMKRGTFRSFTLLLNANHLKLESLTVENSSGPGSEVGQAIALYAEGDDIVVNNCRLLGYQDTLFTGPLPPKEIEKNGFIGPTQMAPRINGHQLYANCYICGEVDFIFGSATAYFEKCVIESLDVHKDPNGYVTAPSTAEGQAYGYVFNHCKFISKCPKETVYLGRPWRDYAKCVIINSEIGAHIKKEGWHDWNKEQAHELTYFAEGNNTGEGVSNERVNWAHQVEDYTLYSKEVVLSAK